LVWDPPKEPVNVTRMIIYSFIPILAIYAGWRIQKFWLLVGIFFVIGLVFGATIEIILPYPYSIILSIATSILIQVYIVRHFAIKYNEKIV